MNQPLMTTRTALLLLLAILIGTLTAALTQWAGQPPATITLAAITATGTSLLALNQLIA